MIPGANVAILAATVAAAQRQRRIDELREAGATSPAAAVALEDEARKTLEPVIALGIVRQTEDGRWWLDEAAHAAWSQGPKGNQRAVVLVVIALAAIGVAALGVLLLT